MGSRHRKPGEPDKGSEPQTEKEGGGGGGGGGGGAKEANLKGRRGEPAVKKNERVRATYRGLWAILKWRT